MVTSQDINKLVRNMSNSIHQKIEKLSNFALFISTWKKIHIGDSDFDSKIDEFFTLRIDYYNRIIIIYDELIKVEEKLLPLNCSDNEISSILDIIEKKNNELIEISLIYQKAFDLFIEIWKLFDENAEPIENIKWPELNDIEKWRDVA